MNKSELVKALADQANISLDEATLVVNTFVDSMKDSLLEGGRVEIRGFGSFKVKEYGSYALMVIVVETVHHITFHLKL